MLVHAALGCSEVTAGRSHTLDEDRKQEVLYKVVVNHEEQYSIWFADAPLPPGWQEKGKSGTKAECLDYIKEVWTDMRPLSLRLSMDASKRP